MTKQFTSALLSIGLLFNSSLMLAAEAPARPVKVLEVKSSDISPTFDVLGTVHSRNRVSVTAGVNGKLEFVAEPGSYVLQGDPVARIEQLPLQLQLAEQQAQLKRAQINLAYLQRELNRQKELRKQNNTSEYQLEQTQSQYELAKSDLEIAQLKLKQIDDQLSRTVILAPFSGVVTERLKRAGSDVNRSEELLQLLDTTKLEVRAFAPIRYLSQISPQSSATLVSVEDSTVQRQVAQTTVIPAADPRSQTFEIRITLPSDSHTLWASGQLIKVRVPLAQERISLSVHRDALILRRDGTYVVKVNENNQVERIKVTVGQGQGNWVNVTGSLKAGEKVVIRGGERLRGGETVVIQTS
ncbi:efflux RND transporter periplasmic adaptor subunit [Pleionea litopenaei]|uniref:Efflux RND transporter periplasmic adaptor subunit n=1 Tax=Pleionea litopenaei TaxID=3070815 RepID=A0AA51RQS0_9GAMM|nr:efflux RND transporter periplasmic adaptor subunit [Pleionea sp. HL-JVS1]WMS85813.1 efflux RND transporter periplasmic adaptor subunit [Pleionea sp. HL-JVS1]